MEEDAETITSDNTMSGNKDTQNLALSSPVSTTETVTTTGTNNSNIENDTPIHQNANTMDIAAEHPEMDREGNNVLSDTSTITFEKGATSSSQRGDEKAKSTKTSISTRSTKDYMTSILARDPTAVVDYKLRVLGVSGLRVADASVMPHIPSGPISATCMAMGAACAEFLHEIESNDSTTT
jgi:choline dehydrogenase-like flavoprotein